jgi:hypothetical protein
MPPLHQLIEIGVKGSKRLGIQPYPAKDLLNVTTRAKALPVQVVLDGLMDQLIDSLSTVCIQRAQFEFLAAARPNQRNAVQVLQFSRIEALARHSTQNVLKCGVNKHDDGTTKVAPEGLALKPTR